MVMTKFFLSSAVVAVVTVPLVAGHGFMGLPKVTFPNGGDITSPAGTIDSSKFTPPSGMSFTTDPLSNTNAYKAWIKTSGFTSLKDLITKKANIGECGNSKVGDPQPLPDQVEWTHSPTEGFTPSHQGPCEIWCDDQMAFHGDNCAKDYPSAPAKLPYDKSKCSGAKVLTAYWLALHSPQWQVYVNCAGLSGSSSGGSSGQTTPTPSNASPTVTPTTKKPSHTSAPAPANGSEDCDEYPEPSGSTGGDADDEDCDDDLPEPAGSEDCDEYPEPAGSDDCDEDLPEPRSNDAAQTKNINFSTYNGSDGEDSPGKVSTNYEE